MELGYENLLMIYYSGTGNSKRVSEWMVQETQLKGLQTHIASYHTFNPDDIKGFRGKTLIAFFSATHGFNMPHSMLRFVFNFKILKGSDVCIGTTRAGMKLSKLFLPGLSGIAMYFPALIMLCKGYNVRAMYPVDLPSNWISLHPGLRKKVIDSMVVHYESLTKRFANKVLAGERVFAKSFVLLPLDILVAPIALGYFFIGRFILAKTFIANNNCNNCGLCSEQCPTHSIIITDNRPYWKFTCESCMKCMNYCPQRAIETAHTLVFVLLLALIYWINPMIADMVNWMLSRWQGKFGFLNESIYFVVHGAAALSLFYFGYNLLHYLMRFPKVNRLLTHTSLTNFNFWRRYKIPKMEKPQSASQKGN